MDDPNAYGNKQFSLTKKQYTPVKGLTLKIGSFDTEEPEPRRNIAIKTMKHRRGKTFNRFHARMGKLIIPCKSPKYPPAFSTRRQLNQYAKETIWEASTHQQELSNIEEFIEKSPCLTLEDCEKRIHQSDDLIKKLAVAKKFWRGYRETKLVNKTINKERLLEQTIELIARLSEKRINWLVLQMSFQQQGVIRSLNSGKETKSNEGPDELMYHYMRTYCQLHLAQFRTEFFWPTFLFKQLETFIFKFFKERFENILSDKTKKDISEFENNLEKYFSTENSTERKTQVYQLASPIRRRLKKISRKAKALDPNSKRAIEKKCKKLFSYETMAIEVQRFNYHYDPKIGIGGRRTTYCSIASDLWSNILLENFEETETKEKTNTKFPQDKEKKMLKNIYITATEIYVHLGVICRQVMSAPINCTHVEKFSYENIVRNKTTLMHIIVIFSLEIISLFSVMKHTILLIDQLVVYAQSKRGTKQNKLISELGGLLFIAYSQRLYEHCHKKLSTIMSMLQWAGKALNKQKDTNDPLVDDLQSTMGSIEQAEVNYQTYFCKFFSKTTTDLGRIDYKKTLDQLYEAREQASSSRIFDNRDIGPRYITPSFHTMN